MAGGRGRERSVGVRFSAHPPSRYPAPSSLRDTSPVSMPRLGEPLFLLEWTCLDFEGEGAKTESVMEIYEWSEKLEPVEKWAL